MSSCHIWTGYINPQGYPMRGRKYAHREAYKRSKGPIPKGKELHHTCRNRACVNPEHLIALTPREHKALHRNPTCPKGHEFTPENTYQYPGRSRHCRQCALEYGRNKRFVARCEAWDNKHRRKSNVRSRAR